MGLRKSLEPELLVQRMSRAPELALQVQRRSQAQEPQKRERPLMPGLQQSLLLLQALCKQPAAELRKSQARLRKSLVLALLHKSPVVRPVLLSM